MKKIIYLFGIVAIMAACSGNKASKEPADQEGTEMQTEENDNPMGNMPEDTVTTDTPADTTDTPVE